MKCKITNYVQSLGVFLIGPKDKGILYEHREMEFGDKYNETDLLKALENIWTVRFYVFFFFGCESSW